jgi:ubiquinol-cytochrome c reductase cytochrome b subunit
MLKEKGVPFWPNAIWRDMAFGLFVIVVIVLLGYFVGAPEIGDPPDPSNINASPRPDWYFMWVFAMFALMPRNIETFFITYGPVILGLVLFALPFLSNKGERSPIRRPWSIAIVLFIVTIITAFWYEGNKSSWSPNFSAKLLPDSIVNNTNPVVKSGSKLFYTKACLYCHSISGQGGHRGPDLTNIGERLTESQITIRIVNGGGNMPAYGATLSQKELKDLVSFLKSR